MLLPAPHTSIPGFPRVGVCYELPLTLQAPTSETGRQCLQTEWLELYLMQCMQRCSIQKGQAEEAGSSHVYHLVHGSSKMPADTSAEAFTASCNTYLQSWCNKCRRYAVDAQRYDVVSLQDCRNALLCEHPHMRFSLKRLTRLPCKLSASELSLHCWL